MSRFACIALTLLVASNALANGRRPMTNGVFFKPGDPNAVYVETTFGLLVSPDACSFYWVCEDNIGFGGPFDPAYAVTSTGAILATTFQGLRVSHDGGCSFTTAANTGALYLDAVEVGKNGEIWVASTDTSANNGVFVSTDDAASFAPRGNLPPAMWYRTVKVASAQRVYVSAYQVSGTAPDGGQLPPSAHLFRSDDDGQTFIEQPLGGLVFAGTPLLDILAVDPTNPDLLYAVTRGSIAVTGDRVYRSADAGATFTEVADTKYTISNIVIRDTHTVIVATQYDTSYESTDGGVTFQPMSGAPQLACLVQRSDGVLFGCGADDEPDYKAVSRSTDAQSWQRVLEFNYITGPLACPAGTAQHDVCDQSMWPTFQAQFGIMQATCAAGPDGVVDGPRIDGTVATGGHGGGCCDAAGDTGSLILALLVAIGIRARSRGGAARYMPRSVT
ncbi:MAG TPA: sialidase family protein [Vicinamibacterales bacterium]|nr:sialidase family protein [Vicinamibacterales bacterium]